MEAIVRFGPQAVPVLVDALGDEKAAVAARALLPRMDVEGIEGLIEAIDSSKPAVRERALLTLESILRPNAGGGYGGMPEGEGMVMAAGGVPPRGFAPAPGAMVGGGGGGNASPQLISIAGWVIAPAAKASRDDSPAVRRAAVRVLGASSQMVPDPAIAAPLAAALKDQDAAVRQLAAGAMINIAHTEPALTAPLSAAVSDPDRSVRVAALTALGSSGAAAKSAMPLVTQALKDSDPTVRIAAANALGAMQTAPPTPPPNGMLDPGLGAPNFGDFPGDQPVFVGAENVWHWCKLKKYNLAKAEADKILKLQPPAQMLLQAFAQVAQRRNMDPAELTRQITAVKELKELGEALTRATKELENAPNAPK
jgi:HEAT repeat protein